MDNSKVFVLSCALLGLSLATLVASQDVCDRLYCFGNGECQDNGWGTFSCLCDPTSVWKGPRCSEHECPDEAFERTCFNGGFCNEIVQGELYNCTCQHGYTGLNCEKKATPCGNGLLCFYGDCNEVQGTCDCTSGFQGTNCEDAIEKTGGFFGGYRSSSGGTPWYTIFFSIVGAIGVLVLLIGGYVYYVRQRNMTRNIGRFHELKQVGAQWDANDD
eukprot:TRINITY_DN1219_c1_g2_i1.p1 TRINITY_DN1219_c1_g2~~TRINITY_DN1219_c1_g2_i1.p1  ORF type:complete len:216 (-),score=21.75 TRINITY_DN1219_c1_g2_i1:592-1239(-)